MFFFQATGIILGQDLDTAQRKLKTQTITRTKDNKFKIETEEDSPTDNSSEETEYDEDDEENSKHSESIVPNSSRFLFKYIKYIFTS